MPQTELLARLDQAIEQADAFSPAFLNLHSLRYDLLTAAAPEAAEVAIEVAFQDWQAQQDYREACLWSNY
ncbi:MAG: hypothetical protein H7Y22_02885 [Gemmatimonadaceae bacterium]|nr:hypothetical protein [Gloeobacterales cyanobacterium ES-bin-141]